MNNAVKVNVSNKTTLHNRTNKSNFMQSDEFWGKVFILPFMAGIVIFLLVPLLRTFYLSFTRFNIVETPQFVGLDNYVQLITKEPMFRKAFVNSLIFAAGIVPANTILAVLVAVLLNSISRFSTFFRGLYFLPVITSDIVFAVVWLWIWNYDYGLMNNILQIFGVHAQNWLGDQHLAMFAVIVTRILKNLGMNVVIILATLQSIPDMYYEAADLDGAGSFKKFVHVTIPELGPVLFMTVMITVIGSFKVFAMIYAMTGGGPAGSTNVLLLYLYNMGFKEMEYGKASAVGVVIFVIVLVLTMVQWLLRKKLVYQEEEM